MILRLNFWWLLVPDACTGGFPEGTLARCPVRNPGEFLTPLLVLDWTIESLVQDFQNNSRRHSRRYPWTNPRSTWTMTWANAALQPCTLRCAVPERFLRKDQMELFEESQKELLMETQRKKTIGGIPRRVSNSRGNFWRSGHFILLGSMRISRRIF